jgi:exopolysaccharide biosynthesis WecB/TagA/CpsF family protein
MAAWGPDGTDTTALSTRGPAGGRPATGSVFLLRRWRSPRAAMQGRVALGRRGRIGREGTGLIEHGKKSVLGVLVDSIDYDAAVDRILHAARERRPLACSALAVHGLMTGVLDDVHRYRLNHLDLVVPDGQPVRWALNWLHRVGLSDRVYGPELTLRLCAAAADRQLPTYFYGSREAVVRELAQRLRRRFPHLCIAGAEAGRFRALTREESDQLGERIRASGAAMTFVGLGCPRQEVFAYEWRERLGMPIIAVGAAFDFHAGRLRHAPRPLQRAGLEWAFRLALEPRRLWRRYLLLNPTFAALLTLELTRLKRFDDGSARRPSGEQRLG